MRSLKTHSHWKLEYKRIIQIGIIISNDLPGACGSGWYGRSIKLSTYCYSIWLHDGDDSLVAAYYCKVIEDCLTWMHVEQHAYNAMSSLAFPYPLVDFKVSKECRAFSINICLFPNVITTTTIASPHPYAFLFRDDRSPTAWEMAV